MRVQPGPTRLTGPGQNDLISFEPVINEPSVTQNTSPSGWAVESGKN